MQIFKVNMRGFNIDVEFETTPHNAISKMEAALKVTEGEPGSGGKLKIIVDRPRSKKYRLKYNAPTGKIYQMVSDDASEVANFLASKLTLTTPWDMQLTEATK